MNRSVTPDGITSLTSTSFSEVREAQAPMLSNNAARTPVRIYLDDLPEGLSLYREGVVTMRIVCRIIAVSLDRQHMHLMIGSIWLKHGIVPGILSNDCGGTKWIELFPGPCLIRIRGEDVTPAVTGIDLEIPVVK